MSRFHGQELACPTCGEVMEFSLAYSINADRRPDLRLEVLNNTIQRGKCEKCGKLFRLDPELTYFDAGRKQWILVKPAATLDNWIELERIAQDAFERAYGKEAAAPARAIGNGIQARIAFGWPAFREKLFCREHQIDDVCLELTKMALISNLGDVPLGEAVEVRLVDIVGDQLRFGWIKAANGEAVEAIDVPRSAYDEIVASPKDWQDLRTEVSAGPFVDVYRLLVPHEEESAAAAE